MAYATGGTGPRGELVTFSSDHGVDLDGILYTIPKARITIVHVHGSFGNFYQNQFLRDMARAYLAAELNFLSFNLSGHDGMAEGYRHSDVKEFEYLGGALVPFEECIADLAGAVRFAKALAPSVVLQGHSMGCDRVLHYLLSQGGGHDFILLSPCDSYQLQMNWLQGETVDRQLSRLRAKADGESQFDWIPSAEYGMRQGGPDNWTYPIPITRQALLSILESPAFKLFNISNPENFWINQNALVYIGGKDSLQTSPPETMFRHLEERVLRVQRVMAVDGEHGLRGVSAEVISAIVSWLEKTVP